MGSGFVHDPHSERGYSCPRNLFGLVDYSDLQLLEAPLVAKRGGELEEMPASGVFNSAHLKNIHKYLFQDVFPWAGEFRVVNISKGNTNFGPARFIEAALVDILAKLNTEKYLAALPPAAFAARAGFYLGEINAIHPFREGNGRTQREFIRQLGVSAGHPLSWAGFTQAQMVEASILSHMKGDSSGLATIIEAALWSTRERGDGQG